ncbi:MAG: DUF624 domain-containing protein [Clostridiales bacterium]|nr:DUF624 domain-containing protein [Clostridiales bacterium]
MDSGFFNAKNPAMRFLTNLCNLMLVNLLFIITCVPLFTIGASLCGLYKIVAEIKNGEEVFLLRDYFRAFGSNFKNATLLWVPILLIDSFLIYELYILNYVLPSEYLILQYPICLVLIISVFIIVWSFPLMANYENTLKKTVTNAIKVGLASFPTTVFVLFIHGLIAFILYYGQYSSVVLFSLMSFFGIALTALICYIFIDHALEHLGVKPKDEVVEDKPLSISLDDNEDEDDEEDIFK